MIAQKINEQELYWSTQHCFGDFLTCLSSKQHSFTYGDRM